MDIYLKDNELIEYQLHKNKLPKIFEDAGIVYYEKMNNSWPYKINESSDLNSLYDVRQWVKAVVANDSIAEVFYAIYSADSVVDIKDRTETAEALKNIYENVSPFMDANCFISEFTSVLSDLKSLNVEICSYKIVKLMNVLVVQDGIYSHDAVIKKIVEILL